MDLLDKIYLFGLLMLIVGYIDFFINIVIASGHGWVVPVDYNRYGEGNFELGLVLVSAPAVFLYYFNRLRWFF